MLAGRVSILPQRVDPEDGGADQVCAQPQARSDAGGMAGHVVVTADGPSAISRAKNALSRTHGSSRKKFYNFRCLGLQGEPGMQCGCVKFGQHIDVADAVYSRAVVGNACPVCFSPSTVHVVSQLRSRQYTWGYCQLKWRAGWRARSLTGCTVSGRAVAPPCLQQRGVAA